MPSDGVPPSFRNPPIPHEPRDFHDPRIPHKSRDWLALCAVVAVSIIAGLAAAVVLGTWADQFCWSPETFYYQPPNAPIR